MPVISQQEAQSALADAEAVTRQSREVYGYSLSAPYCFIWGVAWIFGYMGQSLLDPPYATWSWLPAGIVGAIACVVVGLSQEHRGARNIRKVWLLFVVIYVFSFALFAIFSPAGPLKIAAYWPLLWAAIYCGLGIWLGVRYVIAGAVLGAVTLLSFFHFREHFYAIMALAGGSTLILTGVWLRRA